MQTESKTQILNRLFQENGLLKEDYYEHKHYKIITRSGIEKIQYQNNVTVTFEAVTMTPAFCVVKAHAEKLVYDQEKDEIIIVETFGSAGHNADGNPDKGKQYQYLYYPEMAEKRALSRAVLKICNFYELGVFGEDESHEFKRPESGQNKAEEAPQKTEQPVTPNPAQKPTNPATDKQKDLIKKLIKSSVFTDTERNKVESEVDNYTFTKASKSIEYLNAELKNRKQNG